MSDDENFGQGGDAGASKTYPMQCSSLRKNGHVMIKDRPCKIVDMSTSKTGKHGSAKVHLVGIDLISGRKYEELCPSTHNMNVPHVKNTELEVINVEDDGTGLSVMDSEGNIRDDLNLPEGEIAQQIIKGFKDGKVMKVSILETCDEVAFVRCKEE